MASPIECLPTELLDVITAQLAVADLAHLAQCSKRLHHPIEPVLYAPQVALDRAMYWACKNGQLSTIRLAVAYGADVSIVKVSMSRPTRGYDERVSRPSNPRPTPQIPVLTLYLAARHVNTDAFALLLELGAHIDNSTGDAHVERFFQRLSRNQTLLDHFLKAGLGPEVREHGFYRSSLVSIIKCGGSVNVVRQVLNNGADIKQLRSTDLSKRIAYRTPLTKVGGVLPN